MSPSRPLPVLLLMVVLLMLPVLLLAASPESPLVSEPTAASVASARKITLLDDFEDLSGWSVATSEGARLEIAQDAGRTGRAMRLDFEFQGGNGYVIARKAFHLRLPDNFAFRFQMRGDAPVNDAEFKLVDSHQNVWWFKQRDYAFPRDWQPIMIKKRHFSFAWGPGGPLEEVAVIEFAIAPGTKGKGSIWIDELSFEAREPAHAYISTPTVRASTSADGAPPEAVLDADPATHWRSGALAEDQWLALDFGAIQEYGGLVLDWDPDDYATDYQIQLSDNGEDWQTVYTVQGSNGKRDYLYLPDTESRYLRLNLQHSSRGRGYGVNRVQIQPYSFSGSPNQFFEAIARDAPRGLYPRYFQGEQAYWTVIGVGGDGKEALLNTEGMLESDKGGFSIEPFLFTDNRLLTWADVETSQELANGYLPIPTVRWQHENFWLSITAFAAGKPGESALYARYRLENLDTQAHHVTLFLTVRPFQVNPPWQSLNMIGGVSRIHDLEYADRTVWVNRSDKAAAKTIIALTTPDRFRAATFDQGPITDYLTDGRLPDQSRVSDTFGYASGAFEYGWDLRPGEAREVYLRIPFHAPESAPTALADADAAAQVNRLLEQTRSDWETRLDRVSLELPPVARQLLNSIKSNIAYILINRDGAAIQPGSRTYARSWIRDGALTSTALLAMGYTEEVRQFLQWYAPYQFADGKIPCCVDQRGADPVSEHDSHGEFIYAVMEYYRYTHDVGFVREMWPYVVKAAGYIDSLRQQRLTDLYRTPELCMYCGLVPQSISHEGYSAKPQHSYWDNFFILRGLKDAATMATILGEEEQAERFAAMRDAFRKDLYASISETMKLHKIDYIPGSVELGDFDPTATTIAVDPGGELGRLPQPALDHTFERYDEFFQQRRTGRLNWQAYTPYELRVVGTMVRLGFRERALEELAFFLDGQRPAAWNHWAEVVWRDPKTPRFIGDMPHTWIGSDFIRSVRNLFVYEREADQALVIGAGIPAAWVTGAEGITIKRLPTYYGTLNYRMRMSDPDTVRVQLSGDVTVPPGRIILHSPLDRPVQGVTASGRAVTTFTATTATLDQFPAEVELHYGPQP